MQWHYIKKDTKLERGRRGNGNVRSDIIKSTKTEDGGSGIITILVPILATIAKEWHLSIIPIPIPINGQTSS